MMQMNMRAGIKICGAKGNEALLKELNQLHEQEALLPLTQVDMSLDQRKKALSYLRFIKYKRDGTM